MVRPQIAPRPQARRTPFLFEEILSDSTAHSYRVVTVDASGRTAETGDVPLPAV